MLGNRRSRRARGKVRRIVTSSSYACNNRFLASTRSLNRVPLRQLKNHHKKEKRMFTKKTMLRAAGASLAAVLSLAAQPLRAQGSDAERLQKLEQAVSQLQKRNAELEQEVSGLKKRTCWAPVVGAEGKTKTEVTSDGKTYVEKLVPELHGGEKWKLFPAITELELFGDLRLRYEYRGGRLPSEDSPHPNDWYERERERYRLRLGLKGTVLDDWFFGVRLETSSSARSTN